MTRHSGNPLLDADTAARLGETIDWLLAQLDRQVDAAETLAQSATPAAREALFRSFAETRASLLEMRASLVEPRVSKSPPPDEAR
jgi:hypothetical protein